MVSLVLYFTNSTYSVRGKERGGKFGRKCGDYYGEVRVRAIVTATILGHYRGRYKEYRGEVN